MMLLVPNNEALLNFQFIVAGSWLASHELVLLECCLSSVCLSVVCLLQSWIVAKRCEIDPWLLWDTNGKSIPVSAFQNLSKSLTLDDPEELISRSRKWKWPVSSKRLLLGPGCLWAKMFIITQLIQVHLDLWPWLTFMGHFKVTKLKMARII